MAKGDSGASVGTEGTFEERVVEIATKTVTRTRKAKDDGARAKARAKAKSGNLFEARDNLIRSIEHGLKMALCNVLRFLGVSDTEAREWCGLAPEPRQARVSRERERQAPALDRNLDAVDPSVMGGRGDSSAQMSV